MTSFPPPTEEERRLLREYRLTTAITTPARQPQASPAITSPVSLTSTSSTSSSIITINTNTTTTATSTTNSSSSSSISATLTPPVLNSPNNLTPTNTVNANSTNRKHKGSNFNHELTADELSKISKLVSELGYLKLICPKSISSSTTCKTKKTTSLSPLTTTATPVLNICTSNMFERVDYIKKLSLQKEARRRLKRARNKASRATSISPNNDGNAPRANSVKQDI